MTATRQRDKAAASPYQAYASTDCQSGRTSAPRRPLWTLLEENERTPAGNNMAQIPGFAILIADARRTLYRLDPCSIRLPTTRAARNQMTIVGSAS